MRLEGYNRLTIYSRLRTGGEGEYDVLRWISFGSDRFGDLGIQEICEPGPRKFALVKSGLMAALSFGLIGDGFLPSQE